jgi:hypothetical protein
LRKEYDRQAILDITEWFKSNAPEYYSKLSEIAAGFIPRIRI